MMGAKALVPNVSILAAEAWGMREGVSAAMTLGVNNIIIEGDNPVVINFLRKCWKVPWEINNFIHDASGSCFFFSNVLLTTALGG